MIQQILGNKDDSTIIRIAAYAALVIPICIMLLKFVGTMISGSLSMQAALIDSISDIISSAFVFASVRISQKPKTEDYQFGFGKVQPLGALVQSIFIFASGIFFMIEAYQNLSYVQEIRNIRPALALIGSSLVLLLILTTLQKYVIKKTDSLIIKSSFLHFHLDVFLDVAVFSSILLSHYFNIFFIDSIFGIIFTSFILFSAAKLVRRAFDELMDKSFSRSEIAKLRRIAAKYESVLGIDEILTRQAGESRFIVLSVAMPGVLSCSDVCADIARLKSDISSEFKNSLIHVEVLAK